MQKDGLMLKKQFNFHSDSGHGWLAVPLSLLKGLGIEKKITRCSYMRGKTAYLEEDLDAGLFLNAFESAHGFRPTTVSLKSRDRSPVRSYESFKASDDSWLSNKVTFVYVGTNGCDEERAFL